MQTFAHYALPATILTSAVGAVVLCLILVAYGFKSEPDDEGAPGRRLLVIRLGHALAAACFAASVMLGSVALIEQRRLSAPAPAPPARPDDDVRRLEAQVKTLEQRLAATELRLGDIAQQRVVSSPAVVRPRPPATPPATHPRSAAPAPARRPSPSGVAVNATGSVSASPVREQGETTSMPPATNEDVASSTPSPAASPDLRAKVRGDWETVKRGFRRAGEDVRSGFVDFGRRVKDVFRRDPD